MASVAPHRSARRIIRRLLLGLLLVVALGWLGLSYVVRPGVLLPAHFASLLRISDTPIHIRLAGEDYCLPINYLDAPLDPGPDQRDLFIVALLPDLEARNHENRDEMARTRGWGRRIQMLITAIGDPPSNLANRYQTLSRYGPFERVGQAFGLTVMSNDERARFGRRELYIHLAGDLRAGFVSCRLPGDVPSPSCRHEFIASDRFVVAATYGRAFLSEWQSIAERIERLFEDFRATDNCRSPS